MRFLAEIAKNNQGKNNGIESVASLRPFGRAVPVRSWLDAGLKLRSDPKSKSRSSACGEG
jgi:hypothetical protein